MALFADPSSTNFPDHRQKTKKKSPSDCKRDARRLEKFLEEKRSSSHPAASAIQTPLDTSNLSVDEVDEESRTLWVGGINSQVNEEILFELFINCGPLENVIIPKDKQTMKQRGFGFVIFEHKESLPYAIKQMSGIKLFGQQIIPKISIKNRNSRNQSSGGCTEVLYELDDSVMKNQQVQNNNTNYAHPPEKLLQFNNIKVRFLGSGRTLSSPKRASLGLGSTRTEESQELQENDNCQKSPHEPIRCDKIKLNLLGSGKNNGIQDCSLNETPKPVNYELQIKSEYKTFYQRLDQETPIKYEFQMKTGYKNTEEIQDQETPGKWMENIISPQKCCPEKRSPTLHDQSERSRERESRRERERRGERARRDTRIAEEERSRSRERKNRIQYKPERSQQHNKIIQNGIGDVIDCYVQDRRSIDRRRHFGRDEKCSRDIRDRSRSKSRKRQSGSREDRSHRTSGVQSKGNYNERRMRESNRKEKSYSRSRAAAKYEFSEPVSVHKKGEAKALSPQGKERVRVTDKKSGAKTPSPPDKKRACGTDKKSGAKALSQKDMERARVTEEGSGKVNLIECIHLEEGEIDLEEGEIEEV